MARVTATLEGGGELVKELQRRGLNVAQSLEVAAHVGAEVFVQGANAKAPQPLIMKETVSKRRTKVSVDVGPPDEKWYWRFLEQGVQPHQIKGREKDFVAFVGDEGWVFTGSVSHPGSPAKPFLRPAFDAGTDEATDAVGQKIRVVIER